MKLRRYQQCIIDQVMSPENSSLNLLIQADTGSGKTPILAEITRKYTHVLCIAHRNILIKQLSKMLSLFKIKHDILATKYTKRQCILEDRKLGIDYIENESDKYVCSIDSLLSRFRRDKLYIDTQEKWTIIVDEAHHMITDNKWGKLKKIFPNSIIIGATATPCRLDNESLSSKQGGIFDKLIQSIELKEDSMIKLIDMGFLSPFKCYSLPEYIRTSKLIHSENGDYTYKSLCTETNKQKYKLAGDAVKYYKKLANNKQALAFCINIQIAKETAEYFKKNGISAAAIHSKLSKVESSRIFDLFERKQIKVLFNVDMISEGVDIPAIEVLIMLRKTSSLGMYRQWAGRLSRMSQGKKHGIILDHVANVREHNFPDYHIKWDIHSALEKEKTNLIPCPDCRFLILAWAPKCENCGLLFKSDKCLHEYDFEYVDIKLVEVHRRGADQKKISAQKKWIYENEIDKSLLNKHIANGFVGELINQIRESVILHLKEIISISECNDFLSLTTNKDFWITNFSSRDIKDNNHAKSLKVYKKWLNLN